jgi:hypothetical protein
MAFRECRGATFGATLHADTTVFGIVIGSSIAISWFVFWRFIGRQAASYAWRVHRRRKYVRHLEAKWKANNLPTEKEDKKGRSAKEDKEERSTRRTGKARELRDQVEALFGPIQKPDISRDRDLKESLLRKYGKMEHPEEGWGLLAAAKSFLYYSTVIGWIIKLYNTRAKDERRLKTVSEPQNDVESAT